MDQIFLLVHHLQERGLLSINLSSQMVSPRKLSLFLNSDKCECRWSRLNPKHTILSKIGFNENYVAKVPRLTEESPEQFGSTQTNNGVSFPVNSRNKKHTRSQASVLGKKATE